MLNFKGKHMRIYFILVYMLKATSALRSHPREHRHDALYGLPVHFAITEQTAPSVTISVSAYYLKHFYSCTLVSFSKYLQVNLQQWSFCFPVGTCCVL